MPTLLLTSTEKCTLKVESPVFTSGTWIMVSQVSQCVRIDVIHCFILVGVILIKKAGDGDSKKIKGCWDSIHVVEVQEKSSGRSAHYKLTSTSMLWLQTNKPRSGTMNLGGSLTRQVEQDCSVSEASPHIANIGELESHLCNSYIGCCSYFHCRSSSGGHGKQN